MCMHPQKIFIVEDDERLARLIGQYLGKHGYVIHYHFTGLGAYQQIMATQPDVVVLDLMLPEVSGWQICEELRQHFQAPILILTANDSEYNEIKGLEMGADDYLSKTAEPRVLLARIRALLRRSQAPTQNVLTERIHSSEYLQFTDLSINNQTRVVLYQNQVLELTTAEFDVLWLLANHAGQTMSRDAILNELRGIEFDGLDRSIDARISRLRRKLSVPNEADAWIKTIRGKGYLFMPR